MTGIREASSYMQVLGATTKAEAAELLSILQNKEIVRQNCTHNLYGLHPLIFDCIEEIAHSSGLPLRNAALAAFVEYGLHIADDAAALNASHAQVSINGRLQDGCLSSEKQGVVK